MGEIQRLMDAGKLEQAEALLVEELKESPADAGLHFLLGQIAYKKQQWGQAINHYRNVLDIDPRYPGAQSQIDLANAILGYFNPEMFNP